jgi:hypothetical protein
MTYSILIFSTSVSENSTNSIFGIYLYHRRYEGKLHAHEGHPEEGNSMLLRNGTFLQRSTSSSPQPTCCLSSFIERIRTAFSHYHSTTQIIQQNDHPYQRSCVPYALRTDATAIPHCARSTTRRLRSLHRWRLLVSYDSPNEQR